MKQVSMHILIVLLTMTVLLGGCGKKEPDTSPQTGGVGIDLTTPISDLKAAAAQMDLAALEKTAKQYMDQIAAKQNELEKLMEKFSAIPMAERLGAEAKALQTDISELTDAVNDLQKRLQVYVDYIKEKGGDITKFTLPK